MMILTYASLGMSGFLLVMFILNSLLFRKSPRLNDQTHETVTRCIPNSEVENSTQVSVLIPARNEAARIERLLDSILASADVEFEICVLDDESDDLTADIVTAYSERHANVRLLTGSAKPAGWCGKQYACYQLAQHARFDEFVFLDADVTLQKDALARAVRMRQTTSVDLLSGFPKQRVVTWGEALLIPLIHQVLLCFLPFVLMRFTRMKAAAAGCGQFFITHRNAYFAVGGHSMIRHSLHDGVTLPRAYRAAGFTTNLFNAADIAVCRMYESFDQTWLGLLKNAHEGFAKMPAIIVVTAMMGLAFVYPFFAAALSMLGLVDANHLPVALCAIGIGYLPRIVACVRFDRAWVAALMNPISIILFLTIQWMAWIKKSRGKVVNWRSRSYEMVPS